MPNADVLQENKEIKKIADGGGLANGGAHIYNGVIQDSDDEDEDEEEEEEDEDYVEDEEDEGDDDEYMEDSAGGGDSDIEERNRLEQIEEEEDSDDWAEGGGH